MAYSFKNRFSTSGVVRIVLVLVAFFLFFNMIGQHSHSGHHPKRKRINPLRRSTSLVKTTVLSSSCPRCSCDCLPEMDSLPAPFDCGKNSREMNEEKKKDMATLLSEEINLHKNVTSSYLDSMQQSLVDVKQTTSKYQKEAEKCNAGVQLCEEARERAEAALSKELKLSALWEKRAREFGWKK